MENVRITKDNISEICSEINSTDPAYVAYHVKVGDTTKQMKHEIRGKFYLDLYGHIMVLLREIVPIAGLGDTISYNKEKKTFSITNDEGDVQKIIHN